MSMRKDREITIVRESVTRSSRPQGRLSVSLTEALLEDSTDSLLSLYEGTFLNEKRIEMPGSNKNDKKFLDQHPEVRDLAKRVRRGKTSPFDIDIEGIPVKRIEITNNQNGVPRVYSDPGEAGNWRDDKRTTAAMQEPVIEIEPDTETAEPQNARDPDVDAANADDAATRSAAEEERFSQLEDQPEESNGENLKSLLPEFGKIAGDESLNREQKLGKWLEIYKKAIDISDYDDKDKVDHKRNITGIIENFTKFEEYYQKPESKENLNGFLGQVRSLGEEGSNPAKDALRDIMSNKQPVDDSEEVSDSEAEGGESGVDGGDAGPTDSPPGGDAGTGGDLEGGGEAGPDDGSAGPGDDTTPPPPPTGNAKDVSDYIDKVARDEVKVDLSEIRRPLHKRSLIELLYSS